MLSSKPDITTTTEPSASVEPVSRAVTVASPRSFGPAHSHTACCRGTTVRLTVLRSHLRGRGARCHYLVEELAAEVSEVGGDDDDLATEVVSSPSLFFGVTVISAAFEASGGEPVAPLMEVALDFSDSDVAGPRLGSGVSVSTSNTATPETPFRVVAVTTMFPAGVPTGITK